MKWVLWKDSILRVDDEIGILEAYRNTLQKNDFFVKKIKNLLPRRKHVRSNQTLPLYHRHGDDIDYNLFIDPSGEQAIEIVQNEVGCNRQNVRWNI